MRRDYSFLDKCCMVIDTTLKTLGGHFEGSARTMQFTAEPSPLSSEAKERSARLMRINYSGEICAQALYLSQAFSSRNAQVSDLLRQAAREEEDHLQWCHQRLEELGSRQSYFDPLWYAGSFMIGTLAGIAGDQWNLGFLAETEVQVEAHLKRHLVLLPPEDLRSHAILTQMAIDEAHHAHHAIDAGAKAFPPFLKTAMSFSSTIMTWTSARI